MTATIPRQIVRLGSLAGFVGGLLVTAAHPTAAGEVVIFSGTAPKAAELAKVLWSRKRGGDPIDATRGIHINADVQQAPPGTSTVAQVTAVEPATATDVAPATQAPAQGGGEPGACGFPVRFAFASTEMLPESRPYLDSVGEMLRLPEAQGRRVVIVGHTDTTGSERYNRALSKRRAAAVKAYLVARFGVPATLLEVEDLAEEAPLPELDLHAPQNRRVEFHAAAG